jgi:hypothetical protein
VKEENLGVGAKMSELLREEITGITPYIREFCRHFDLNSVDFLNDPYFKVTPASARPFASKYTWEV